MEHLPGAAFNNERDQKLCQAQDHRAVTSTSTGMYPRFGCYCEHKVAAVFGSAKFTEFGFILLPWQLTEAQTSKRHKVISYNDDA